MDANLNALIPDENGRTALSIVIEKNNFEMLGVIYRHRNENEIWDRCEALFLAVQYGKPELFEWIRNRGVSYNCSNYRGPLIIYAVKQRQHAILAKIVDLSDIVTLDARGTRNARKPDTKLNVFGERGKTALMEAAINSDWRSFDLLFDAGASVDIYGRQTMGVGPMTHEQPPSHFVLLELVRVGNRDYARKVLERSTQTVNLVGSGNKTPWEHAKAKGDHEMMKLLEEFGGGDRTCSIM